ncbi:protocadherin-like protein [Physella acuta]|uniref:protocadherin-like protein n=1 Tax=Physella acuta TaxID=109671 RepID=UPI0027DCD572|nr:protocadherin-like protein [Physella acuta]
MWYLVLSLLLSVLALSEGTLLIAPTFTKVAMVNEGTTTNEILSSLTCTDSDGDLTSMSVKSMTPSSPCSKCFEVLSCGAADCLQYRAGVGTLDYTSAQYYLVTVSCTDNKETPVTEVIEVEVIPNSPPYFDPDKLYVLDTMDSSVAAGQVVYDVDATDDENDDITYSLEVLPSSSASHYIIDKYTGKITTTVPLKAECNNDVTFRVTINDGKNTAGPLVIDKSITNPNTAPVASNLDTTIQIPEDATGTAYKIRMIDGNGDPLTYTVTSSNAAGFAQFKLNPNGDINIASALDYENVALRQTDLQIQATDGYCPSPKYSLRLQVTDVNEPPTISPVTSSIQICEGQRTFSPGYKVIDPDTPDTQRWYFDKTHSDPNGYFSIDSTNGDLTTLLDYNVDNPNPMPTTHTFKVVVADKGGLTATATVSATFVDCNDNPPVFVQPDYVASATECTAAGTKLITITATDKDSSREQNNVIYYQGSGGSVYVGTGGEVIVGQAMPAGTVVTFEAYAFDKGQTPGPLRSVNPAVISVRFTPCPTTQPPVVVPTTAAPATTTSTTTTTTTAKTKVDSNLPWIIIAALLGAAMLGLLACMLWRYGHLCLHACKNFNCEKKCCRPRPRRILTPKVERRQPVRSPIELEPEEKEPPPKGPGFLFGFWKERFPDDDFKQEPQRKTLPAPGDMDAHYPHTIDAVEDPLTPQVPDTAAPKKNCVIM